MKKISNAPKFLWATKVVSCYALNILYLIVVKSFYMYLKMSDKADYPTYVERFTVRMSNWSLIERTQLRKVYPDPVEMSNINPQYIMKPYQYAYMGRRIFLTRNEVLKVGSTFTVKPYLNYFDLYKCLCFVTNFGECAPTGI